MKTQICACRKKGNEEITHSNGGGAREKGRDLAVFFADISSGLKRKGHLLMFPAYDVVGRSGCNQNMQ